MHTYLTWFVCLLGFFVPLEMFHSYHIDTSPLQVKGCKFWPMLGTNVHIAVKVLIVPNLLWHGASVYNGRLRGPVTLPPIDERLEVELSKPVFMTCVCRGWESNTQPSACERSNRQLRRRGLPWKKHITHL